MNGITHRGMIGYVFDDGGREAAGYRGLAGDCVARALAILTGGDYREIYRELAAANKKAGEKRSARNGVHRDVYAPVFEARGLVKVPFTSGPRPTLTEAHRTHGNLIFSTARHVAAIVDGCLRDTWDGRTYEMPDQAGYDSKRGHWTQEGGVRERKAMSIWTLAPEPSPSPTCETSSAGDGGRLFSLTKGGESMTEATTSDSVMIYCLKCRDKVQVNKSDTELITMKNGRPARRATCPKCDGKLFRIGK